MNLILGCAFVASLYVPGAWRAAYAQDSPDDATYASRFDFERGVERTTGGTTLGYDNLQNP